MLKVRKGGGEEIPLVQGKEQRLRFAGAAVKRYPTFKVKETHTQNGIPPKYEVVMHGPESWTKKKAEC